MPKKPALPTQTVGFIETMDCLPVSNLPEGPGWTFEIKLDGYRLEVVRGARETTLYSRRRNVFNQKFPYIAAALKDLPDETVIDGELVAIGSDGRPDFNLLQNFRFEESRIHYYAFDILVHKGRRLTGLPLSERRAILSTVIEPGERVALSQVSDRPASEMLKFAKDHGLEGVVAKRADSVYQRRTGVRDWRLRAQPFGRRFSGRRLLPRQGSHLRCPRESRIRSGDSARGLREDQAPEDAQVPIRQPSRAFRR
jgi:ATP-dependent DNA ligase